MGSIKISAILEYRSRVIKDIVILITLFFVLFFLYIKVREPFPIRFVFSSTFQNIRTTLMAEYSKIYYPVYYFSKQAILVSDVLDNDEINRELISDFFYDHDFIEKFTVLSSEFTYSIERSNEYFGGDITIENVSKSISTNILSLEYDIVAKDTVLLEDFYISNDDVYIKMAFYSKNNIKFLYDSKFNTGQLFSSNDYHIKDIYSFVISDDNIVVFPIDSINEKIPENYVNIIREVEASSDIDVKDDQMIRFEHNGKYYWIYKGDFTIEGINNTLGIIAPEESLTNKLKFPILMFFFSIIITSVGVIIFFSIRYIKIIESIRRNHDDLNLLIKNGENTYLEFKSSLRYDMHSKSVNKTLESVVMKSIAAFSNALGGRLIIGVSDDGQILGLEDDYSTLKHANSDFFELHLRTLVASSYGDIFSADGIRVEFLTEGNKEICVIDIKKGKKPLYTKVINKQGVTEEKFYMRTGNSSREMGNMSEVIVYIKKRFR